MYRNVVKENTHVYLIGLLLLMAFTALNACSDNSSNTADSPATSGALQSKVLVHVQKAIKTTKHITRRFSGYSYPWESHGVGFLVAGRISSIKVREGDSVKRGDLLATIDAEDYALVEKLAKTQVDVLAPNYKRVDDLVNQSALPQVKLDEIKGRYEAALTQQQQARRQRKYTKLYSPTDGIVSELRTSVGQVIGQGSPAVVLLELNRLKVKFGISQTKLSYFKVGQKVTLSIPGVSDSVDGTVFHIDFVADKFTRTYDVVVEILNKEQRFRPSMLAHLNITLESIEGYFLPLHAIMRDNKGVQRVFVVDLESNKISSKAVTLGRRFEETIEITSGLMGNENVVISGNNFIHDGDTVVVK